MNFLNKIEIHFTFTPVVKMPSTGWKNLDNLFQKEIRVWHLTQTQVHVVS